MRGECICGDISFEITGNLPKAYQCHCSLCRKQGGSSSNTGLIIGKNNFRWLRGQDKVSLYVKDTGFCSNFCSQCGSVVPNTFRDKPYIWVPAGALDDSEPIEIALHICVGSKASWDMIPPNTEQLEGMPSTLSAFIDLLHTT